MSNLLLVSLMGIVIVTISVGSTLFIYHQRKRRITTFIIPKIEKAEAELEDEIRDLIMTEFEQTESGRQLLLLLGHKDNRVWSKTSEQIFREVNTRFIPDETEANNNVPEPVLVSRNIGGRTSKSQPGIVEIGDTEKRITPGDIIFRKVYSMPMVSPGTVSEGKSINQWGKNPPVVEGTVQFVDMQKIEERFSIARMISATLLIFKPAVLLAYPRKEHVQYTLIVRSDKGIYNVKIKGDAGKKVNIGDYIAIWGKAKGGIIVMEKGYNYTTNSLIRLRH